MDTVVLPVVQRLRERFVDATIVATNVWAFGDVHVLEEKGEQLHPFLTWLKENGFEQSTPEARDLVKESNVRFAFETENVAERDMFGKRMALI